MVVSVRFQEFGLSLCLIPTEIFGHWQHWPAPGSVTHWTGGFTHGGYARPMCGWKALSHAPTAGIRYYSMQIAEHNKCFSILMDVSTNVSIN